MLLMVELQVPEMVNNYLLYCNYKNNSRQTNVLDLRWLDWLYPTTLLPLGVFTKKHSGAIEYRPPLNQNVANYMAVMTGSLKIEDFEDKSYVPFVFLPQQKEQSEKILELIYKLHRQGKEYGGENAFKYLVGELVNNIYEHSEFTTALVMAQRYKTKKFVEICFFDDGITIPGSFQKKGMGFKEDSEAIMKAINGLSTKGPERGYGLSTNFKIFTVGLAGEILLASGGGAVYAKQNFQKIYKLQEQYRLEKGTLIAVRIPFPATGVNIYEFIN